MAIGKSMGARLAELEVALEKIRDETWKPGQTLSKLRRAIALILRDLNDNDDRNPDT